MLRAMIAVMVAVILCAISVAYADAITINGESYANVYVTPSGAGYVVRIPEDGRELSVAQSSVMAGSVRTSEDPAERAALLRRWENARGAGRAAAVAPQPQAVSVENAPPVRLNNVPLKDALAVILRQQNLAYEVRPNYIYVSTPERLRNESVEPMRTEVIRLKNAQDTLPKVVVSNAGGMGGSQTISAPTGNAGGGAGGGGTQSAGAAAGGGGGASFIFSNISQLFSTIDDRAVGEPPAVIGGFGGGLTNAARN